MRLSVPRSITSAMWDPSPWFTANSKNALALVLDWCGKTVVSIPSIVAMMKAHASSCVKVSYTKSPTELIFSPTAATIIRPRKQSVS